MPWYGADANKGVLNPWYGGGISPLQGLEAKVVAGGAAGDIAVTGIGEYDDLVAVFYHDAATPALTDLTSEFTITADDTINNTGGTSTAAGTVMVVWAGANEAA